MITICPIPYIYTTRNQTHSSMTLSRHLSVTSKENGCHVNMVSTLVVCVQIKRDNLLVLYQNKPCLMDKLNANSI